MTIDEDNDEMVIVIVLCLYSRCYIHNNRVTTDKEDFDEKIVLCLL